MILAWPLVAGMLVASSVAEPGTSALAAWRVPLGTAEAGRGGAGIAFDNDGAAFVRNPATAAAAKSFRVHAAHTSWLFDSSLNHTGLMAPLGAGTLSAGVTVVDYGDFERRGQLPTSSPEGSFAPSDVFALVSYAYPLEQGRGLTSVGVNLQGMTQRLDTDRASGVSMDLGIYRVFADTPLALGGIIRHLGPAFGPGDDPLPLTIGGGLRFFAPASWLDGLRGVDASLALDGQWVRGASAQVMAGIDVALTPGLTLRFGRNFGIEAEGLSAGADLGIPGTPLQIGYAFTDAALELDALHRFDITLRW